VTANIAGFIGSAQAYTDAVLGLTVGFLVGGLFASAALDERLAASQVPVEREKRTGLSPLASPV
jgi:hypothetical protein